MASSGKAVGGLALLGLLSLRMCNGCSDVLRHSDGLFDIFRHTDEVVDMPRHVDFEVDAARHIDFEVDAARHVDDVPLRDPTGGMSYSGDIPNDIRIDGNIAVVDRPLSSLELQNLIKQDVKFICDTDFKRITSAIQEFEVIFVHSDDHEKLKNLYGVSDEQVEEVKSTVASITENPFVNVVEDRDELLLEIKRCKNEGVTPVLVFNNKENRLFDAPIEQYGVENLITCKSYGIPNVTFATNDFVDLEYVVEGLNNSISGESTLFEFYVKFSDEYSSMVSKDRDRKVVVMATASLGVTGGIVIIVYYNHES